MVASLSVLSALIPDPFQNKSNRGRSSGYSAFSSGPHLPTHASDPSRGRAQRLESKDSQEGILREDEVELQFQPGGPPVERDRTSELGLHASNDVVVVGPSPVSTYPVTTFPTDAPPPNRQSKSWAKI